MRTASFLAAVGTPAIGLGSLAAAQDTACTACIPHSDFINNWAGSDSAGLLSLYGVQHDLGSRAEDVVGTLVSAIAVIL